MNIYWLILLWAGSMTSYQLATYVQAEDDSFVSSVIVCAALRALSIALLSLSIFYTLRMFT